jgi:hypothetical protein
MAYIDGNLSFDAPRIRKSGLENTLVLVTVLRKSLGGDGVLINQFF